MANAGCNKVRNDITGPDGDRLKKGCDVGSVKPVEGRGLMRCGSVAPPRRMLAVTCKIWSGAVSGA